MRIYLLILPLLLAACSPKFEEPAIAFESLRNLRSSGDMIQCDLVLSISNRDPKKWSFRLSDCIVKKSGNDVGTLTQDESYSLRGYEAKNCLFALEITKQGLITSALEAFLTKKLKLELEGSVSARYLIFFKRIALKQNFNIDTKSLF